MKITKHVYDQIVGTVGKLPTETGGLLAGPLDGPITHYYYDEFGVRGCAEYSPDTNAVNRLLKEWPEHIRLRGFVHSHPSGYMRLSGADIEYATRIVKHNKTLPNLQLPIVQSAHDGGEFNIIGYEVAIHKGRSRVKQVDIEIVSEAQLPAEAMRGTSMFDRVRDAYDLDRMANSLVMVAGVGGATTFVEDMARAGVGYFALVDPDVVSITNLATQRYYRPDIGRPKVHALADRIRAINPDAKTITFANRLEKVTLEELQQVLFAKPFAAKLLVAMTDSFPAQAAANRMALSLRIPLLTGQLYPQGRAAELVYTVPGVTPACMRCALSSRYAQYSDGYTNTVTSHGSPIFSGESLNSAAGTLALAILHHGSGHPRWGDLIQRAGARNLLQLRFDPDIAESLELKIFDQVLGSEKDELFYGETIWRTVKPDNQENGFPTCPDCGGTGDLLNPDPGHNLVV